MLSLSGNTFSILSTFSTLPLKPTNDPAKRETFWLNSKFSASIGPGWKVGYTQRLDVLTQELVSHDLNLYRTIHCWEFAFSWTPSGTNPSYFLKINVLDKDLSDIKYESKSCRYNRLSY